MATRLGLPPSTPASLPWNGTNPTAVHPSAFSDSCSSGGECAEWLAGSVATREGLSWEVRPQEGIWGLGKEKKLTGETRQEGNSGKTADARGGFHCMGPVLWSSYSLSLT